MSGFWLGFIIGAFSLVVLFIGLFGIPFDPGKHGHPDI